MTWRQLVDEIAGNVAPAQMAETVKVGVIKADGRAFLPGPTEAVMPVVVFSVPPVDHTAPSYDPDTDGPVLIVEQGWTC